MLTVREGLRQVYLASTTQEYVDARADGRSCALLFLFVLHAPYFLKLDKMLTGPFSALSKLAQTGAQGAMSITQTAVSGGVGLATNSVQGAMSITSNIAAGALTAAGAGAAGQQGQRQVAILLDRLRNATLLPDRVSAVEGLRQLAGSHSAAVGEGIPALLNALRADARNVDGTEVIQNILEILRTLVATPSAATTAAAAADGGGGMGLGMAWWGMPTPWVPLPPWSSAAPTPRHPPRPAGARRRSSTCTRRSSSSPTPRRWSCCSSARRRSP